MLGGTSASGYSYNNVYKTYSDLRFNGGSGYNYWQTDAYHVELTTTPRGSIDLTVDHEGNNSQAAKPPTIAFMWILRFI